MSGINPKRVLVFVCVMAVIAIFIYSAQSIREQQRAAMVAQQQRAMVNEAAERKATQDAAAERAKAAQDAASNYTKAALLFRQADKIDPTAGLKKAAVYSEKRSSQESNPSGPE